MKPLVSTLTATFIAASLPVLAQAARTEHHIGGASQSRLVKVGDSVQFRVERIDGALTVVELRQRS
jgi:hypothetical protein